MKTGKFYKINAQGIILHLIEEIHTVKSVNHERLDRIGF